MRKNVFPLYKTMVEIRQKHIFLRFFSEEHLLLTADWSHLCRSRSERRTANLTTTKIRQISLGKVGKIQLSWATPKSWKKERKSRFTKPKDCNTDTLISFFSPWDLVCFVFAFSGKSRQFTLFVYKQQLLNTKQTGTRQLQACIQTNKGYGGL